MPRSFSLRAPEAPKSKRPAQANAGLYDGSRQPPAARALAAEGDGVPGARQNWDNPPLDPRPQEAP